MLTVVYAIILLVLTVVFDVDISITWFALALVFLGLYLFKKALIMNSDSSLWFSVLFILIGFVMVLYINLPIFNGKLLLLLSVCVALASFVVFIVWKNKAHFYMFITNILGVAPAVMYSYKVINLVLFIISVILVNVINLLMYKLFISLFAKF